jgi:hypothetical protein
MAMLYIGGILWILGGVTGLEGKPLIKTGVGEEPKGPPSLEELVQWRIDGDMLPKQLGATLIALETKAAIESLNDEVRRLAMMLEFLRTSPLHGKIVGVRGDIVVLSVGKGDGAKPGLIFRVSRGSQYIGEVRVTAVYKDMSGAEVEYVAQGCTIKEGDDVHAAGNVGPSAEKKTRDLDATERGLLKIIGSRAKGIADRIESLQQQLNRLEGEIRFLDHRDRPGPSKTLSGAVTAVRERFVEISAGRDEGVLPGMVFTIMQSGQRLADATVVVTWQHQAGLVVTSVIGSGEIKKDDPVMYESP